MNSATRIFFKDLALKGIANQFSTTVKRNANLNLQVEQGDKKEGANVVIFELGLKHTHKEAYQINIDSSEIHIQSVTPSGAFYAMQTLVKSIPVQEVSEVHFPATEIKDYPRFAYRGMMLDVSRHFSDVEMVKRTIDILALHNLNVFHWHLTDDQGWRLEIKSLPRLTEVGAWRAPRVGQWWQRTPQQPGEETTYGGFYTQEDVKEVLAYAAERYVRVIPEIDVPGHSLAALVAYPDLACMKAPSAVGVGNKFYGEDENTLCVGKDATFEFMDKVLTEVAALFPDEYIHIGGDECFKGFWHKCPRCQARMKAENLKNENELQSYFIHRMESILKEKGKKLIGWDEILEGGLAPDAVVMSWRGTKGGIAAARQQHEVIMTPSTYLYFDKKATDSYDEPVSLSSSLLPLEKIYGYDPAVGIAPEDRRYLLGVQANLWTEFIWTEGRVSFQLLPRIYALSEIAWSPVERKSWEEFSEVRLPAHLARIDATGEPYRLPAPLGIENGTSEGESFSFTIRPPFPGCKVCYTLNGAVPQDFDREMPETFGIAVPRGEQRTLRCVTIAPSGRRSTVTTVVLTNQIQTNNPE